MSVCKTDESSLKPIHSTIVVFSLMFTMFAGARERVCLVTQLKSDKRETHKVTLSCDGEKIEGEVAHQSPSGFGEIRLFDVQNYAKLISREASLVNLLRDALIHQIPVTVKYEEKAGSNEISSASISSGK